MPPKEYRKPQPFTDAPTIRIKAPPQRPRYEYTTLSAERPLTAAQLDSYGVDGWRIVGVYVRMDAVHVIFEREVMG
jgi:hypothetical protein